MNLFNPDRLIIFPADDPQLVKQLQNDTKVYLAKSGDHRYADGWAFTKMAVLVIACFSCYLLALSQHQWGLYLLWYLATMFCAMLLAVNVVHDASHDAFLRGKRPMSGLTDWLRSRWGLILIAGGCAMFAFITALLILNFTILTPQKMAFFARLRGNGGDRLCVSNIATGRWSRRSPFPGIYGWWTGSIAQALRR